MARDTQDRLHDIIQSLDDIALFTQAMTRADFADSPEKDRKTFMAIKGAFIQLGEAVKKLPETLTERYTDIRWSAIARMRDKITHHYHEVQTDIVWDVISGEDLKRLKTAVEAELRRL